MHVTALVVALSLTLTLMACGKKEEAAAPVQPASPAGQDAGAQAALATAGASKYRTSCAVCHGPNAEGMGNYPPLAGLSREEIRNKLMDYRAGKQMGPLTAIMAASAGDLTDTEIESLAAYLGR